MERYRYILYHECPESVQITQWPCNEKRLFPELKLRRDGYGQDVSKWFARYRKRIGIDGSTKVFHSFRHTVIDQLKQQEAPKEMVANIAGHLDESVTFGRYSKNYQPKVMQQYI